jgi:hypothetical protein
MPIPPVGRIAALLAALVGGTAPITAQRGAPPPLTGRVVDEAERPLEGLLVTTDEGGRATTDLAGRFTIAVRECGAVRVSVRRPGAIGVTRTTDPCDPTTAPLDLVLRPLAQRLDAVQVRSKVSGVIGIVTDRRGAPLAGVEVALLGARAPVVTDSTGRFALLDVPPGAYLLRARERSREAQQLSVGLGEGDVREVQLLMTSIPERVSASRRDDLAGYGIDEWWYVDLARRRAWRGAYSAIVSREELLASGERDLTCALVTVSRVPRVFQGLQQANCAQWSPPAGCVIVDGRWNQPQPLWAVRTETIELVELYAPRADFSTSSGARARSCPSGQPVAVVWLRR